MLPNNLYQLIGWFLLIVGGVYSFVKSAMFFADAWKERQESKSNADVAKVHENLLTASQVALLLQQMNDLRIEINGLKQSEDAHTKNILKIIAELEMSLDKLTENFTSFLMSKAIAFDENILNKKSSIT